MAKKKIQTKKLFTGRDAVAVTAIWVGVYLLVLFLLNGAITSSNVINMFVGLIIVFILGVFFRNGW